MSFQDFAVTTSPQTAAPRLAALRAVMVAEGVDAFLVPRADAHQGEYVAPRDARLGWLTGFTGSAGACVVLADRAALFVDGRYTLQARAQTDAGCFEYLSLPGDQPKDWLAGVMEAGQVVAYDPWLHVRRDVEALEAALDKRGVTPAPGGEPGRPGLGGPAAAAERRCVGPSAGVRGPEPWREAGTTGRGVCGRPACRHR